MLKKEHSIIYLILNVLTLGFFFFYRVFCNSSGGGHYSALPTDPKSSIFSFTVALMASAPGARSFLGS